MLSRHLSLCALLAAACAPAEPGGPPPAETAAFELMAADRAFGAAAAGAADVVEAIAPMLAAEVVMPGPGPAHTRGRAAVLDALRANPENLSATVGWEPAGGGISADGLHGYTFGYMTLRPRDGEPRPFKYLAYWVKGGEGWRVAAYRRIPAPGFASSPSRPLVVLPEPGGGAPGGVAEHRASLMAAEQAFSDEAQRIGLGPAFVRFGTQVSINLGGARDTTVVVGAEAIGELVGGGEPEAGSSVYWSADDALVAPSGDLGVTFGVIRTHRPGADGRIGEFPFFTVWRRSGANGEWRYVAE